MLCCCLNTIDHIYRCTSFFALSPKCSKRFVCCSHDFHETIYILHLYGTTFSRYNIQTLHFTSLMLHRTFAYGTCIVNIVLEPRSFRNIYIQTLSTNWDTSDISYISTTKYNAKQYKTYFWIKLTRNWILQDIFFYPLIYKYKCNGDL